MQEPLSHIASQYNSTMLVNIIVYLEVGDIE